MCANITEAYISAVKGISVRIINIFNTVWELIYRNVNEQRNNGVITSS